MKNHCIPIVICFSLFLIVVSNCKRGPQEEDFGKTTPSKTLFTLLPSVKTHVNFQNTLSESLNMNILLYEYFYNGGGVAVGDVNGDALIDIYFTSNMGDNALYINMGDMKFKEATHIAGVSGRSGPWKTGVTMVDINADHKLDLYVCYSGALPEHKRKNQLFINQGNDANGVPVFVEEAEKYGLASAAYSNQAYFFDYDRDGDLDMLLLNHNPKAIPILNEVKTAQLLKKDEPVIGVRLYQQNNGFFEDVTTMAGISGSALTYGLGLGIGDLNNDQWPDFYISNDYAVPDYLYINNGNGTFTNTINESLEHTSHFSMGNDIADVNNDGWLDIFTLDMLPEDNYRQKILLSPDNYEKFDLNVRSGFHYQYMRNMLQLNNGNGTFSEIGQLAGCSNTDWSWAALLADYDNNGWKDLFVTNGYYRDYTHLDFINYMEDYIKAKGRLKREQVLEIIQQMPSSNITNYSYSNTNGTTFVNTTKSWGLDQLANSNGAAYADLDNDGDLDVIVNNINQPAFIYQNQAQQHTNAHYLQVQLRGSGGNTQGLGATVVLYTNQKKQSLQQSMTRGYLSSVAPVLHFGLGKETHIDSLIITWNTGKQQKLVHMKADQFITLEEKNASTLKSSEPESVTVLKEIPSPIPYKNPELTINDFKRQSLLIKQLSYTGPCMTKGDVNNDGLEDVFIGGAQGQSASLYIQQSDMRFIKQSTRAFKADSASEDADAVIFDANNDGHPDIYVASGGYHHYRKNDPLLQDRLYVNDGHGNFLKKENALPKMYVSKGCIAVNDINADGYPDLFVGGRVIPGRYPETPQSYLLINDGKGNFIDQTSTMAPELQHLGMITDAIWQDLNGDRKNELIVVGEWLPVSVFTIKDGKLQNVTPSYFDTSYSGWWNTIEAKDVNKDGKPDLVVGNMGTNTQFKVSKDEPAELYFKDFDQNGSIDPLFCYYLQGKSYPYLTRDELLGQLVNLRSHFTNYTSYADATLTDIFDSETLNDAGKLIANHMETTLFTLSGAGKFEIRELPIQAQYAPIHDIVVVDVNRDSNEDILLFGNNHHFKLRLGKFDANYGMVLLGDGTGGFVYLNQLQSGLKIRGAVQSALQMHHTIVLGINQDSVKAYQVLKIK